MAQNNQFRRIESLTFNADRDPELLKKLNAIARHTNRNGHNLARHILTIFCDKKLPKKNQSEVQSARAG